MTAAEQLLDRIHELVCAQVPGHEQPRALRSVLARLEQGQGTADDIDLLLDLCDNILGRAFCALGDGATSPVTSAIKYFRDEFEAGTHTPADVLFPPERSSLFAYTPRRSGALAGVHA